MSLNKVFNVKDKVFARRQCYPPWPAIIYSVNTNTLSQTTYNVYLYGNGDCIECKEELLVPYEENKSKFNKLKKNSHNKSLVKAFFEIENTTDTLSENDVQVSSMPSCTKQIFHPDKSKDVDIIQDEYSENKEKSTINVSNKFKENEDFISKNNVHITESKKTKRIKSDFPIKICIKKPRINKPLAIDSLKLNETQLNLTEEKKSKVKKSQRKLVEPNLPKSIALSQVDNSIDTSVFSQGSSSVQQISDLDKFEDIDKINKISDCNPVIGEMLEENKSILSKKKKKVGTPKRKKKRKLSKKSMPPDAECLKETKSSVESKEIIDQSLENKSINFDNLMLNENQPIVLVEVLNDQLLAKVTNENQNTVSSSKVKVDQNFHETSDKNAETISVTKSTVESSDASSGSKKPLKLTLKINDLNRFNNETTSKYHLRRVSCSSLSSKTKKTSKRKNKSSHSEFSIQLSEARADQNASKNETDDILEQNCETKDTSPSLETENTLKLTPTPSLHNKNNSISEETHQLSNKISKLPSGLKEILTDFVTSIEIKCNEQESKVKKMAQVKLLQVEVDTLDCIFKLRSALSIDHFDYKMALQSLEQMNKLEINALMLIKHPSIVDTIMKVSMYIGNAREWKLSEAETIKHTEQCVNVRHKAQALNNKFILLFTKRNIGQFKEIYDKKVKEFKSKTRHLARDQIYGCTSVVDL